MKTEVTPQYMFLVRGSCKDAHSPDGARSPEEMQAHMTEVFAWIDKFTRQGIFTAAQPLTDEGRLVSGGSSVTVSMRQTPLQLQLLVSDNGRGIFDAIGQTYQISDPDLAMLELAKGKLSTRPDGHNGRGLFFTARLADIIDLHANAQAFQQRDWQREQWHRTRPACQQGSAVYVAFSLDTQRRLDEVLRRYSLDGQSYGFDRTVVPLQLATSPQVALASRAQAQRVALRLQRFRRVELDFDGLAEVGHGFADELLRVFQHAHPEVDLVPVNMSPRVAAMVAAALEA